jgi:hyperosmotically inducible protein
MKITERFKIISVSMLLVAGLAACEKQNPGPAESAGKNIDRTMDQVGQKIGDTTDKVGDKLSEGRRKVGVAIDDTEITAKIKAAFLAESGLKTLQISVDTLKGAVTLKGSVEKQSQSDMARAMASAVSGVNKVNNELAIRSKK